MSEERFVRRYRVHGRVQGVGFRAFVWRRAQLMGLDGWVRNRLDGSVEALVMATPSSHDALFSCLEEGPRWSRVDRVEVTDEPGAEPFGEGFDIRRDG